MFKLEINDKSLCTWKQILSIKGFKPKHDVVLLVEFYKFGTLN